MGGRSVADIMSGVRFDRKRKIANNTVEYWQGKTRVIRLHDTDIVKILENGDTVLNSGGWRTVTTKDRMSGHGSRISQEKGVWYVPSLLMNAIEEIPISQMTKSCVGFWLGYHDQDCGYFEKYAAKDIEKVLIRYLKRRFGIAS